MGRKQKKQKTSLPPDLPPEPAEDDIEVSDEDVKFFTDNSDHARFVSGIDIKQINKHVNRVANVKDDALEALYEKRKKRSLEKQKDESQLQVDAVDALPVKTPDGRLYYKTDKMLKNSENVADKDGASIDDDGGVGKSSAKLTKVERRAKLKKSKKDAKKQAKDVVNVEDVQKNPQSEVLAEIKEELSAEEACERKKVKLAELGIALLADPESNIKHLKEMLEISKDHDIDIVKLGLLSLLAVFKDIIPGYRIRLPTEKEQEMTVSKAVRKMRYYESTLLSAYKAYLQKLMVLEKVSAFKHVAIRCICTLLEVVPHFNFRESLLASVVRNIGSPDDIIRKLSCAAIKSIFSNEGKHSGEATIEAVQKIADHVKANNCQLHPDSLEVFLSLSFDEDLGKPETMNADNKVRDRKNKKRRNVEEPSQLKDNDKKKNKRELQTKTREEVYADYNAASLASDVIDKKQMQSETLSAVFQTYFRILKHTVQTISDRSEVNASLSTATGNHPLLSQCLIGIGKFSHLIDVDFMGDIMNYLKRLASAGSNSNNSSGALVKSLTVSERLQCCVIACKVMKSNLDALNVDLNDFFVQLYNLIPEYVPGRDQGSVLAEAFKLMLCDGRQHDMQRAAAFAKRLAMFSLCSGSAESMAGLVTLKHLLQKNVKCRNLLENDAGGGSVSGSLAKYQPYSPDPNLCGAFATVLWELNLLSKHYNPAVSTMASGIASMGATNSLVHLGFVSPQQAFQDSSLERESFDIKNNFRKLNHTSKKASNALTSSLGDSLDPLTTTDEDAVRKKISEHFALVSDIAENEKLRSDLERTKLSVQLYGRFKQKEKRKR